MFAFAAGAAAFVWFSWPGPSSNSALLLNRAWMAGTLLILAVLPLVIRRQLGPVRGGWVPRAVRVGGYALILVMIAAKARQRGRHHRLRRDPPRGPGRRPARPRR